MLEVQIAQEVQLIDLMLEYFSDDGHWARGRFDDGNGGHCLVGALLHLSRKHHGVVTGNGGVQRVGQVEPSFMLGQPRPATRWLLRL